MMNNIKRKVAGLCIGVMALGGVVALDVAAAPKAEAATTSYTYMWNQWAPAGKKCQIFIHIKQSPLGHAMGYKDSYRLYNYLPDYACGR